MAEQHPVDVVTLEKRGAIAIVHIDNPPVNAIGLEVRSGLMRALDQIEADDELRVVVLVGHGRGFMAGADIREFGKPPQEPGLPTVCDRIEACSKPVLASIHGAALGGGLEVALASHYRIAQPDAKLGLPEVNIGLLPGAGGTVRTPRLIGVGPALDIMLSGRHVGAREALKLGLVDRVGGHGDTSSGASDAGDDAVQATSPSDAALADGVAYAQELMTTNAKVRRTRDQTQAVADKAANEAAIAQATADVEKRARGLFSPRRIIEVVRSGLEVSFDEAQEIERKGFMDCLNSPQRAGLIHVFFAEREVAKAPETKSSKPRQIARTGVVGGGTMGAGIAVAMLDAGLDVTMIERDEQSVVRGRGNVEKVYDSLVKRGRMKPEQKEAVLKRFSTSTDYQALAQADLVVEAVFEEMGVKKGVFAELDRVCRPGAVLATNTSYLDVNEIADTTSRPQDVIGLHFFSPANIMKLLEVVVPAKVAPDVVATAFELGKRLRKVAVRSGVCDGFIGNRILGTYREATEQMMLDGASPYEIDRAMVDYGFAMGPYQVSDLAGGDIGWATRKRLAPTRNPKWRTPKSADRMCEKGWFGQKTGRGYYLYPEGSRTGQEDPEVLAIIDQDRKEMGITPRKFSADEIVRRFMAALINEGADVLHEKIALRPLDIDVVYTSGYGFPRHRGGPMMYADSVGLDKVLADIREFAKQDPEFWKPSPLLVDLVERGENFDSLNRQAAKA